MASLAAAISGAAVIDVSGTFQRHSSPKVTALAGSAAGGRWGYPRAYPVLYLGRPTSSVTIEVYRHLVDAVEGMTGDKVAPPTLWTVQVEVTNVLDLRDPTSQNAVSLTLADLQSPIDEYERCRQVAQAAYQLQLHGLLASAAEGTGETLALFEQHLPAEELPTVTSRETWAHLPPTRAGCEPSSTWAAPAPA